MLDDEGYLSIVGRLRDVLRTGGETVAPTEIEAVLADHPAIAEVVVVGLPDAAVGRDRLRRGRARPRCRRRPSVEDLRAHCDGRLAAFKHPRRVEVVDGLPRTSATGQVQRTLLVERLGPPGWNRIPGVENLVSTLADRSLADRHETYAAEIRTLLDAALTVMRRDETIDPRVSDIVRTAGLCNQAFYRHFRGKDELLVALLDDGRQRLLATIERRMARADTPADQVRAWIEAVLAQARDPEAAGGDPTVRRSTATGWRCSSPTETPAIDATV